MSDIAAASRRRRRTQATLRVVLGIACPVFLLALWELAATQGLVDRRFFPPPTKILASAWSLLSASDSRAQLLADTATTLRRLGIGYGIGSVAGIGMGMAMGLYGPLRHAFSPIVYGTFPTPKIAIYPLLIAMFGIGEGSKFALVILGVFYMTCINTLSGVLYSNPIHRDVIKAFHIPPVVGWFRVVLPSAMPAIVTRPKKASGSDGRARPVPNTRKASAPSASGAPYR